MLHLQDFHRFFSQIRIKTQASGFRLQVSGRKGFTLLELLIVIAIIAILSVVLILVLNPAEQLAKARDSNRISDLSTLKTALGIFVTTVSGTNLDLDAGAVVVCVKPAADANATIAYSKDTVTTCPTAPIAGADAVGGGTFSATDWCYTAASAAALPNTDGTGWLPVDFSKISGGSPINSLPLDPTNSVGAPAAPVNADLVYRYGCVNAAVAAGKPPFIFEIDAQLESTAFTSTDDKRAKDGGDHATLFEVGNSVKILPTTAAF